MRLFDGEPYVIAGLKRQTNIEETAGAPFLEGIPGLGLLFGGETNVDRWNEVVITVTPHFQLASQADQLPVQQVGDIAAIVEGRRDVSVPSGSYGYDMWLFDK